MTEIRLVPLGPEHAPDLERLVADEAVLRFTRVPEPAPEGFVPGWIARYLAGRVAGTSDAFAILDADGRFAGLAVAPAISREERTVELGYVLAADARGRGLATAALRGLSEWAFAELGAERIELRISVDNAPSQRLAERCGYVREGVLRSAYFKQGRREDTELWSLLPSDPR